MVISISGVKQRQASQVTKGPGKVKKEKKNGVKGQENHTGY